jgi:hypothetical protein
MDNQNVGRARARNGRNANTVTIALRLAVLIRVVGDVRREGEGPDRAAS